MTQQRLILNCTEKDGRPPITLRQAGLNRILHRPILSWSSHTGYWDRGGAGFFALELAETRAYYQEWLVLILFCASEWLLLDNHWVAAHPNQYATQRPLFSFFGGDKNWDNVSPLMIGAKIRQATLSDYQSRFILNKADREHVLRMPRDTSRLPRYGGTQQPRNWPLNESHWDAWVLTQGDLEVG